MTTKLFLNDKFILLLILINAVTIFLSGFEMSLDNRFTLTLTDNLITVLFITELIVKFKEFGIKGYFNSNWRKFDFILIALSIPSLIAFIGNLEITNLSFLLVFRVMRIFKSFRFLKFIPGIEHLIKGINRALKASIFVFIGFIIYIFIISILSFYLFKGVSPEHFGNPLNSLYTTFKIFTVEGWYEIPDLITHNLTPTTSFFTYLYFIFVVISGGIFGLSLVNSIFVDAMVSDNNDTLEIKIDLLEKKIDNLLYKNKRL
ncbi:ion transporter [Lutibacter sp. A64]|uniref:ion transporter n=1 Tax=Lutibacter sp. A64 TaxID=2918526 RepID=UPI001F06E4E8|nr:ion transporter [Lutibacter sp. A64]UMB52614.1 ion transporter [Lutibacter sp. A64]